MPKVSVILPFKNAEPFLEGSIQSLIDQDFKDWELILVDNGSTDNGREVALNFETKDPRISYIEFPHGGVASAFNFGFKKSKGDVIARMDADDIAFQSRLSEQLKVLGNDGDKLVYSPVKPLGRPRIGWLRYLVWQNSQRSSEEILLNRFVEMPVCNPTLMVRKETLIKIGSYDEAQYPEDYEFFLRAAEKGVKIQKTADPQLFWRDHDQRLTRRHEGYSRENFFRVKASFLFRLSKKVNPRHPEIATWGTGKLGKRYIDILEEKGFRQKAFFDLKEGSFKRGKIQSYKAISNDFFLISLVSNRGAGGKIQKFLEEKGFDAFRDFAIAG